MSVKDATCQYNTERLLEGGLYLKLATLLYKLCVVLQPLGLAAHSSVMVGNNTMLVLGGLRSGQLSSVVLTYSVDVGVWDVWRSGAVPGML